MFSEIILDIVTQNNIILTIPHSLNRDTRLTYNCVGCNKEISKNCRYFIKNHLCSTCAVNNKQVPYEKSISYLYPEVASMWHPTKNKKLPTEFKGLSMKKVWWLCKTTEICGCLHEFEANICDVVKCRLSSSKGCPFCTNMGSNKRFCLHKSLGYLFPEICRHWSKNNITTPQQYLPRSLVLDARDKLFHEIRIQYLFLRSTHLPCTVYFLYNIRPHFHRV